jgi:hypothetical protein
VKTLLAVAAVLSLAVCLASPVLFFLGKLSEAGFKLALVPASLAWFVLAALWAAARKKRT